MYKRNVFIKNKTKHIIYFQLPIVFFKLYLDEIQRATNENRILVYINNLIINPNDYILEEMSDGINVRFKKANFPYVLTDTDVIYLMGDVQIR